MECFQFILWNHGCISSSEDEGKVVDIVIYRIALYSIVHLKTLHKVVQHLIVHVVFLGGCEVS